MQIDNFQLKNFNTFGISALAKHYFSYSEPEELISWLSSSTNLNSNILILGGGSNLLFTQNYNGTIIHPQNKGIQILDETTDYVIVTANAAEKWDDFVLWSVKNNLYGIENLSGIPGNIGASPIQNIGAYGMEASDTIIEVRTIEIATGKTKIYTNSECNFGYRQSIFKQIEPNSHIVVSVIFKLLKKSDFKLNYGSLQKDIEKIGKVTLQSLRETILQIRFEKLPNPEIIGNAGSFFKNPVISIIDYKKLQEKYPNIISYPISDSEIKIAAGWLLETLGFKGYSLGNAKVHDKQALVITNTGNASGNEIVALSKHIQTKVLAETNIQIEPEVIFI